MWGLEAGFAEDHPTPHLNDCRGLGEGSLSAPVTPGLWAALYLPLKLFHGLQPQLSPAPVLAEQSQRVVSQPPM